MILDPYALIYEYVARPITYSLGLRGPFRSVPLLAQKGLQEKTPQAFRKFAFLNCIGIFET